MKRQSFKEFLRQSAKEKELSEEMVGKGFAVGQQARFASKRTALHSQLSKAQNNFADATRSSDLAEKIDALAGGFQLLAAAIDQQGDLLNHILNVSVADVLLSDDVGTALKKHLAQRR